MQIFQQSESYQKSDDDDDVPPPLIMLSNTIVHKKQLSQKISFPTSHSQIIKQQKTGSLFPMRQISSVSNSIEQTPSPLLKQKTLNSLQIELPQSSKQQNQTVIKRSNTQQIEQPITIIITQPSKRDADNTNKGRKSVAVEQIDSLLKKQTSRQKTQNNEIFNDQKKQEIELLVDKMLQTVLKDFNYAEIKEQDQNILDKVLMEKLLIDLEIEKGATVQKIKFLRQEFNQMDAIDIRHKYVEIQIQMLKDKQLSINQIIVLYKDKLNSRAYVQYLKQIIEQLTTRIINVNTEYTEQINMLNSCSTTLQNEKEMLLSNQIKKLQQKSDQDKQQILTLQESVRCNLDTFQQIFTDAEEAKQQIICQLKEIQLMKENLGVQQKKLEEQRYDIQKIKQLSKSVQPQSIQNDKTNQSSNMNILQKEINRIKSKSLYKTGDGGYSQIMSKSGSKQITNDNKNIKFAKLESNGLVISRSMKL